MADGIAVAGIASLRVDDKVVSVAGNVVVNVGTPVREDLPSATGPVGYKETDGTPTLEFETVVSSSINIAELLALTGVGITVVLKDGRKASFSDAWAQSDGNFETEENKLPLVFKSLSAEWV